MRRVGRPNGKVSILCTFDVDQKDHIVYCIGVDDSGKYYSVKSMSIMLALHIPSTRNIIFLKIPRLKI